MEIKQQVTRLSFIVSSKVKKLQLRFCPDTAQLSAHDFYGLDAEAEKIMIKNALAKDDESSEQNIHDQDTLDEELSGIAPILVPHRTLLYGGGYHRKACNFITANRYRNYIQGSYRWAVQQGFDTFITDLATPFGLLALETLLEFRDKGESFCLYAVRSKLITLRKSYRLIRETPIEMIILEGKCDYTFLYLDNDALVEKIISKIGACCNTNGIRIIKQEN